jgi:hypothetical protein
MGFPDGSGAHHERPGLQTFGFFNQSPVMEFRTRPSTPWLASST